jgi:hypothetical protein
MNKQKKLDRLKKDGWIVTEFPFRTKHFEATKGVGEVKTKNIYNLHKQIFGY